MFFRRTRPKEPAYQERFPALRAAGFKVEALSGSPGMRFSRGGCATVMDFRADGPRVIERAGIIMNGEIGALVDGGFQKFFLTPGGKRTPALASDLRALHDFEEDLRDALGQVSLYNESLGTVSAFYLYDRVKDRDRGVSKRVWE